MATIGEAVSGLRNTIKAVKADAFITDRYLYSRIVKYGSAVMVKQGAANSLLKMGSIFRSIPCLELEETNRVEASCLGIKSNCLFKRTIEEIPSILDADFGPIIRTVSSIDGSIEVYPIAPGSYASMTKTSSFKYNRNYYYWYLNNRLYFPNLPWDAVMLDALFEGDVTQFSSDEKIRCSSRQEQQMPFPDDIMAEVEQMIFNELGMMINVPPDVNSSDKQNVMR